jgi:hypothetical protein
VTPRRRHVTGRDSGGAWSRVAYRRPLQAAASTTFDPIFKLESPSPGLGELVQTSFSRSGSESARLVRTTCPFLFLKFELKVWSFLSGSSSA